VDQSRRVLFARVSWMTTYNGAPDDAPSSTMSYVTGNEGPVYERFNFRPVGGRLYGYFAHSRGTPCHLKRVAPVTADARKLEDVLIVFVAQRPRAFGGGQVVVGWYRDATLYPQYQDARRDRRFRDRPDWDYCCECLAPNGILLPTHERTWQVPRAKGGMGTAKIRYFDPGETWMTDIVDRIDVYVPSAIREHPGAEIEDVVAAAIETVRAQGQGYQLDVQLRRNIEEYAVTVAKEVYERAGYRVEVHGRPFDLYCRKRGDASDQIWVEVKGTQGDPVEVILTHGEVRFYRNRYPRTELLVVHSIAVENGRASGGIPFRHHRWKVDDARLQPIAYRYRIPRHFLRKRAKRRMSGEPA
jgi:hypothetical protein